MESTLRHFTMAMIVMVCSLTSAFSQVGSEDPSVRIDFLSKEGDSLRRAGDYAPSIEVYGRLLPLLANDSLRDLREIYLIRLGLSHSRSEHWNQALDYFDRTKVSCRESADTLNSTYGHAFLNSGVVFRKTGRYQEALRQYENAIRVYASAGDSAMCNTARMGVAIIYQERAEYDEALERYVSAALSFEAMGDSLRLGEAYSCIGNVQESIGHLSRAEEYYRKSLTIRNSIMDADGLASTHNNLGTLLRKEGQFDSSVVHLRMAIHFMEMLSSSYIGRAYHNLAKTLVEMGEVDNAIQAYESAAYQKHLSNDTLGLIVTIAETATLYSDLDSLDRARFLLDRAATFLERCSTDEVRMEYLDALSQFHLADDRLDSALICIAEREHLRERINEQLYLEEVALLQERYEAKRREDRIVNLNEVYRSTSRDLEQREAEVSRLNTMLLLIIALISFGVIAIVFIARSRKRAQELRVLQAAIAGEDKEKRRIARELHDAAGSRLRASRMKLATLVYQMDEGDLKVGLRHIEGQIDEVSKEVVGISHLMHQPTFEHSSYVNSIRHLLVDLVDESQMKVNFEMDKEAPWDELKKDTKTNIYRIIQEAIINVLRHANAHSISISARMNELKGEVLIQDDGRNDGPSDTKPGIGLQNMRERAAVIFGDIQFRKREQQSGMEVILSFPLRQNRAIR